jgi:hypothetical protein
MANNRKQKKSKKPNLPKAIPPQTAAPKKSVSTTQSAQKPIEAQPTESYWQPYDLDHYAQNLAIQYRDKNVLNESHKMRMTVAYGLERFWGEPFRLDQQKEADKVAYWRAVWDTVAEEILKPAGIVLPNKKIDRNNAEQIQAMAAEIWQGTETENRDEVLADREVALMVLTQFCDCLVWWAQRYKIR